jgi:hypothetical protein
MIKIQALEEKELVFISVIANTRLIRNTTSLANGGLKNISCQFTIPI